MVCNYIIISKAVRDGLEIVDHYRGTHNRKHFISWDKRDGQMISYLVNHGFNKTKLMLICKYWGEANSGTYVTNTWFDNLKANA